MTALARGWQKRRGVWLDVIPALCAVGLMLWLGLAPLASLPGPEFELADKVWHLIAFGGLAGLLSRTMVYLGHRPSLAAREASLGAVMLGGMLEVLQSFTRYRSADWADFVADGLGVTLAYAVLWSLDAAAAKDSV
jgi:hypothetical protein